MFSSSHRASMRRSSSTTLRACRRATTSSEATITESASCAAPSRSIGVAIYPDHGNDPEELLQRADIAMYTAKETHAGFVLFDHKQDQHSPRRLALLGELRRALDQHQLLLHYQPKVDAHTGQLLGVEALVRWQHPTHGMVPPGEFIPLAERTGLTGPLTHYVLDEALRQGRQWSDAGHELSVAVNVSARRLLDLQFPDEVAALLDHHQVPTRLLVIELTESTIMADPVHALDILTRLNTMGIQLSIDDIGTGYSSMAYLKHLPVHELRGRPVLCLPDAPELQRRGDRPFHHRPGPQPRPAGRRRRRRERPHPPATRPTGLPRRPGLPHQPPRPRRRPDQLARTAGIQGDPAFRPTSLTAPAEPPRRDVGRPIDDLVEGLLASGGDD